ncbi:hypothetical protein BN1058_00494 [Paraliobacillus sp. PM-2]|nr:hypothetical protein BN1058_00494 [Paraliobacillus sp. PM-2]
MYIKEMSKFKQVYVNQIFNQISERQGQALSGDRLVNLSMKRGRRCCLLDKGLANEEVLYMQSRSKVMKLLWNVIILFCNFFVINEGI